MDIRWDHVSKLSSVDYICGYCGKLVASDHGYFPNDFLEGEQARIYLVIPEKVTTY